MSQKYAPSMLSCTDELVESSDLTPLIRSSNERVRQLNLSVDISNALDVSMSSMSHAIVEEKASHPIADCSCHVFLQGRPFHLDHMNTAPEVADVPAALSEERGDAPFRVYPIPSIASIHWSRTRRWFDGHGSGQKVFESGFGWGAIGDVGHGGPSQATSDILSHAAFSSPVDREVFESEYTTHRGLSPH